AYPALMGEEEPLDPELRRALDERIDWINQVTDLCRERGGGAIHQHIDKIDDQHLRSTIYVLILARVSDHAKLERLVSDLDLKNLMADIRAAEPGERDQKIMALENYIVQLQMQIQRITTPSDN